MEPGPSPELAADLDAWYRQEHLEQMSKEPGWHRSRRYSLLFNVGSKEKIPSYLALYEFDETVKLGTQVQPLDPMTEWTKKCMRKAQKIEAGIYRKMDIELTSRQRDTSQKRSCHRALDGYNKMAYLLLVDT